MKSSNNGIYKNSNIRNGVMKESKQFIIMKINILKELTQLEWVIKQMLEIQSMYGVSLKLKL